MREKLKLLDIRINSIIKHYRVKYYYEFAMAVFCFGLACIYLLYVWVLLPVYAVHHNTTMTYNIVQAIRGQDLAGVFFALDPSFDLISAVMLFGGCLWGVSKLFYHSLAKISEIELVPLAERILEIEKEGKESGNDQTISNNHNPSV